jgi:hypothetical protein
MKFLTMPSGWPLPMTKRYPFVCEHVVCEQELRKITIKTPKNKAKTFLISVSFHKIPKKSNYKLLCRKDSSKGLNLGDK